MTELERLCAGFLILMEKIKRPNQMMRICERLGMYDRDKLAMDSPVFDSMEEFIKHHGGKRKKSMAKGPVTDAND